MTILSIIIVGAIVGWLAGHLMGRREGILGSIIIGIIGSFIGSLLSGMLTGGDQAGLAFDWSSFLWSLIGAVILVAILNAISRPRHTDTRV
jgi:uncharacterized membrane protein YeaQ/YmgE (transglycosylase-associated protein family)